MSQVNDRSRQRVCFYCADQNPERDKSRGITNYTVGLLGHLRRTGRVSLSTVVSRSSAGALDGIPHVKLPFRTDHIPGRLLADHLHPLIAPQRDVDVWHYPKGFLPFGRQVRAARVGTIADTILHYYADKYPQERSHAAYRYWISMLKNSITHFDLILTISEFSRKAILEFCARYRLETPPIRITYLGVDDFGVVAPEESLREEYVLHLASELPHKKTCWLLEQWRSLQAEGISLPQLRLVGQCDSASAQLAASLRNVETFVPATREEMLRAMKNARALLLPSEIEGFGLPAVESYLAGTPVAYVKGTAVEEVLGHDAPGGFRLEADSFRVALTEILGMGPAAIHRKSAELRDRFSWDRCVERTLAAYDEVDSRRKRT